MRFQSLTLTVLFILSVSSMCGCDRIKEFVGKEDPKELQARATAILEKHKKEFEELEKLAKSVDEPSSKILTEAKKSSHKAAGSRSPGAHSLGLLEHRLNVYGAKYQKLKDAVWAEMKEADIPELQRRKAWEAYWEKRGVEIDLDVFRGRFDEAVKLVSISSSQLDEIVERTIDRWVREIDRNSRIIAPTKFTCYPRMMPGRLGGLTFKLARKTTFTVYPRGGRARPATRTYGIIVMQGAVIEGKLYNVARVVNGKIVNVTSTRFERRSNGQWEPVAD